jgi:hypothetical protein
MFRDAWERCRSNLLANLIAGIFLWVFGAAICFGYYNSISFASLLNQLGSAKTEFGYLYSAISTAIFGGLIPYFLLLFRKNVPHGKELGWFCFFAFFWAVKGIEVDAFYRLQSILFGDAQEKSVVVSKVLFDQFVYCVLWAAPTTAVFYGWKNANFNWGDVKEIKCFHALLKESVFLLVSTWLIWIPAVTIVYSMPPNLQIPLFNLTLCFFVLVISLFDNKGGGIDGTRTRDLRRDRPAL